LKQKLMKQKKEYHKWNRKLHFTLSNPKIDMKVNNFDYFNVIYK
jgi:hypothetical protein